MTNMKVSSTKAAVRLVCALAVFALGAGLAGAQGQNGTTLTANVTASPHWNTTYGWTINKAVDVPAWNMFMGDAGTSTYTVALTKDGGTTAAWIDGQVCVTNGGAVATENLAIVANLTMPPSQTVVASVNVDVSAHPILAPGETFCYAYRVDIPTGSVAAGDTYKVDADVTITNHSGHLGLPWGPSPSATAILQSGPSLVNDTVNVTDTNGTTWPFSASGSQTYTRTFACGGDAGTHPNTATISETGQSASASVTVTCFALSVSKDAHTSLTRTYNWTINKSADHGGLTLAAGEQFTVNYTVQLGATTTDSQWAAHGTIVVQNPAPMAAPLAAVTDAISGAGNATVTCPSLLVPAGGSLVCTYTASLPDAAARLNTVTAVLQNNTGLTTSWAYNLPFDFTAPAITKVDECIAVNDTYDGGPHNAQVCWQTSPSPFGYSITYARTIGPYAACGQYTVENTASFVGDTTGASASSTVTIPVNVPCAGGCTLTQGYWKTHSSYGPAPYDDTWAQIGEDTLFYSSNQSWYQVLWTPPQGGNAYYILGHQYIAARLNGLNGASDTPAVDAALVWAEAFFNKYTPTTKLTNAVRNMALAYAALLDQYNSGLAVDGPPHCSE